MTRLTDQFNLTQQQIAQRLLKVEKWQRDVTGNSPLFDIANENTPGPLGASQNDYDPGFYDVLRIEATTSISITGIARGQKGRFLELCNISAFIITLPYESASSIEANRIINSSGQDIRLFPTGRVRLYYDATIARWVVPDPPSWKGTYGMATKLSLSATIGGDPSAQMFTSGVSDQILFDTVDPVVGDPYGFFDSVNNWIEIPSGMDGHYSGMLSGTWDGLAGESGTIRSLSYQNIYLGTSAAIAVPSINGWYLDVSCPINLICAAGDIIAFYGLQESGGDLKLSSIELHFGRIG